jgi:hypothetical protein
MKNYYLIFTLLFTLLSCHKENSDSLLSNLTIDNIKELIPIDLYESSSHVIFVNQNGDEKSLKIEIIKEGKEKLIEGEKYLSEYLAIHLIDEENPNYSIVIEALVNYWDLETVVEEVSCLLFNLEYIPTLRITPNREPSLSILEAEKQLLNKSFSNVYSNFILPELNSYSVIYYTIETGAIGFKDHENNLWVYERFEI